MTLVGWFTIAYLLVGLLVWRSELRYLYESKLLAERKSDVSYRKYYKGKSAFSWNEEFVLSSIFGILIYPWAWPVFFTYRTVKTRKRFHNDFGAFMLGKSKNRKKLESEGRF